MSVSRKHVIQFVSFLGVVSSFAQPLVRAYAQDGIAEVVAVGSGCPAGTWQAEVSADGMGVTSTFSEFFAVVDASQPSQTTDCQLRVGLSSAGPMSFAVDSISVSGYAHVEPDMSATIDVYAYFQGQSAQTEGDASVDGPYDGTFHEVWTTEPSDLVWSPCGVARNLLVNTRLGLRNAETATPSWIDLSANEAGSDASISVRLLWRQC